MRTTLTFRSGTVLQHRVKLLFISTFLSLIQITHTGDSDRFRQSCNAPGCRRRLQQHLLICVHILQWRPWGTFKATGNDNQEQSRSPIVADGVSIRKVSILISNATLCPWHPSLSWSTRFSFQTGVREETKLESGPRWIKGGTEQNEHNKSQHHFVPGKQRC